MKEELNYFKKIHIRYLMSKMYKDEENGMNVINFRIFFSKNNKTSK